jgi:hypothetical protein
VFESDCEIAPTSKEATNRKKWLERHHLGEARCASSEGRVSQDDAADVRVAFAIHTVQVQASSLYEAAGRASQRCVNRGWAAEALTANAGSASKSIPLFTRFR